MADHLGANLADMKDKSMALTMESMQVVYWAMRTAARKEFLKGALMVDDLES